MDINMKYIRKGRLYTMEYYYAYTILEGICIYWEGSWYTMEYVHIMYILGRKLVYR
jgi:hypothetical protein